MANSIKAVSFFITLETGYYRCAETLVYTSSRYLGTYSIKH